MSLFITRHALRRIKQRAPDLLRKGVASAAGKVHAMVAHGRFVGEHQGKRYYYNSGLVAVVGNGALITLLLAENYGAATAKFDRLASTAETLPYRNARRRDTSDAKRKA